MKTRIKCDICGSPIWRFYYPIAGKNYCHACIEAVKKPVDESEIKKEITDEQQ